MFAGKKSAQIREILISESAWEEMTCLFASSLDQSLLLDDVANKAGYTKWYFQRLFKKVTGVTLASYIRARRLTKAAVELRLTKKTILEIALKYQFDSQQSFTRRFKYIFKVTPSYYRRNKLWELEAMH